MHTIFGTFYFHFFGHGHGGRGEGDLSHANLKLPLTLILNGATVVYFNVWMHAHLDPSLLTPNLPLSTLLLGKLPRTA